MHKVLAIAGAAICIVGGLYLLTTQAAADDSLIESFMHGVGIYFIGKGVFVGSSLWQQDELRALTQSGLNVWLEKDARDERRRDTGSL